MSRNTKLLLGLLLLALVVGGGWWFAAGRKDDAPKFRTAKVEKGPITATVSSTGTLNPVTSVQVGSQVSGQIKELFVDFNSPVKQGMLIARIDPETFQYRVRQAEADLEAARSGAGRAEVAVIIAERDLKRTKELVARSFVSPAELDRAQSTYDLAAAELKTARAVVQQRNAALASAKVDLSRTEIRAPVDGVVIKRTVDVGQTVAASLQAPELFVIAKDLRDMQVETSIDEADVGRIRVGQRASFTVDAFPGRPFAGEVKSVRKAAQNVQNVVTYIAIISANNERGELLPGMTANVRITTDSRESRAQGGEQRAALPSSGRGGHRGEGRGDKGGASPDGEQGRREPGRRRRRRCHDAVPRAAGHRTEARRPAAAAARPDLRRDAQQVHGPARPAGGSARQAERGHPRRHAREDRGPAEARAEGEVRADRRRVRGAVRRRRPDRRAAASTCWSTASRRRSTCASDCPTGR